MFFYENAEHRSLLFSSLCFIQNSHVKLALYRDSLVYVKWLISSSLHSQFCHSFLKSLFRRKGNQINPCKSFPSFWGLRPHGFFHFHFNFFHHCSGFLAVSSNDWKLSLSRYCFSVLRWACSSMLQCLRTGTL